MESFVKTFQTQGGKKVSTITVRIEIQDCTGTVKVTDLMLQGGSIATLWVGHPSEIRWSFDA